VVVARSLESFAGVWLGFGSALVVWGWHELSFLQGVVTGPWREACPPDARGWRRFRFATLAVIHHELALTLTLVVLVALTWGAVNQVATVTFGVLWVMRLSAKLNLFFGVRNLSEDFIPEHLRYLKTFFRRSAVSPLLVASVVVGVVATCWLGSAALDVSQTDFSRLSKTVCVTLFALAVLEHVFLAVPLGDGALWRWVIRDRALAVRGNGAK
jgi:putative photosynthetic complex assembly protein 2